MNRLLAGLILVSLLINTVWAGVIDKYQSINRRAEICPDYTDAVIPPNIAPLNFVVKEDGSEYFVQLYSEEGEPIEIFTKSANIQIPDAQWHRLLSQNRGNELHVDIFAKTNTAGWARFETITNRIANEDIDGYLVYRRMAPFHLPVKGRLGIFQRNLGNFDEKVVLDNRRYNAGCVNCHSFCRNSPDKVLIGVRAEGKPSTLLTQDGRAEKINAKLGFTSWHPSGKLAAFSADYLPVFFHTAGNDITDTIDMRSGIRFFVVDSKASTTLPELSKKDQIAIWPNWSADGRYLYFCRAPAWTKRNHDGYRQVKYDLARISYDIDQDKWGRIETVLSAKDNGRSSTMPRTSPDGKWLVLVMCDYGFFPLWQTNSDLYIIDLKSAGQTGKFEYRRLEMNSDKSESWHSWSSNGRWIVFSSKRWQGLFTRSYFGYVDENGNGHKPIVLPQEDPQFYDSCLDAFNTPEFVTGPLAVTGEGLADVARGPAVPATFAAPEVKQDKGY